MPSLLPKTTFASACHNDNDFKKPELHRLGTQATTQQAIEAREKEIKARQKEIEKRNLMLIKLRKLAARAKIFHICMGSKSRSAEPAHRCQTALMSQTGKKDLLFTLTADDFDVEMSLAPKLGAATDSYYKAVRLKSDELDRQYMEEAKKRRMQQLSNQGKLAKVGKTILADYGEEGLVKGKITDTSFFSAAELSKTTSAKRSKIENGPTNDEVLLVKAIHVQWSDKTVEWIELPDPDVEIDPPFCPPEKDNYAIPNLLDAIRPFATAPEYDTPVEMKNAGTELLPYQKRFLHWGLQREGFHEVDVETKDVLDPRHDWYYPMAKIYILRTKMRISLAKQK